MNLDKLSELLWDAQQIVKHAQDNSISSELIIKIQHELVEVGYEKSKIDELSVNDQIKLLIMSLIYQKDLLLSTVAGAKAAAEHVVYQLENALKPVKCPPVERMEKINASRRVL